MPKNCCVTFCTNNASKNPEKKFYMIPNDRQKRNNWLVAINRAKKNANGKVVPGLWSPKSRWCYVCSDHFISGERSLATSHPDYVPSLFPKKTTQSSSKSLSSKKPPPRNSHQKRATKQQQKGDSRKTLRSLHVDPSYARTSDIQYTATTETDTNRFPLLSLLCTEAEKLKSET